MNNSFKKLKIMLLLLGVAIPCRAIDNPDAPDYVAEFQQRAQEFEVAIHQQAKTTQESLKAYANYELFLDKELNNAYQALLPKLAPDLQKKIKQSQRDWVKYRDAEFEFIAENWTPQHFGSSAVLSRGGYRTTIINNRVMQLLYYLKNY
ncbi:MAG: DUF1311 domain-containing protein [Gammaproteobacteria bacterium]|nr:DUF1311 domain-containing protein [Gammaproteobacteria bacterium]